MKANAVLPTGTKYSFDNYAYLVDIAKMRWEPWTNLFIRKSSQCGASEFVINLILWMNERKLPNWKGCGYIFPAREQLNDHVKARVIPILETKRFAERISALNLRFIKYDGSPIYFRSGQTRRELISFPADCIVIDEFEEFENPMSVIPTIRARFNASEYKWLVGLSTPKFPGLGIDAAIAKSNQHNWYVECDKCHKPFSPLNTVVEDSFENCVGIDKDTKKAEFICPLCHELTSTHGKGFWNCDVSANNKYAGYSISRLFTPNTEVQELWEKYNESLNIQEFFNSDLGLPYAPENARLSRTVIEEQCNYESDSFRGQTWMGADVGKKCYYTIGILADDGRKKVIAKGVCGFEELARVEARYNVGCAVIDLRPYEQEVKNHIRGRRGFFACDFNAPKEVDVYRIEYADENTTSKTCKIVKAARTELFDMLINDISVKKVMSFHKSFKEDQIFLSHLTSPVRMDDVNKKTGESIGFYNSQKADHYFLSLVYLNLAFQLKKRSIARKGGNW